MYNQQLIYAPTRQTHLDIWLSYIAFVFDLHFPESLQYVKEHSWIQRSFERIQPQDPYVKKQYEMLKQRTLDYIK